MAASVCFPSIGTPRVVDYFSKLSSSLTLLISQPSALFFRNLNARPKASSTAAPLHVYASSKIGLTTLWLEVEDAPNDESKASSSVLIREHDLLVVGPGVLGRLVAEKWRQEYPSCAIHGQTATSDHHDELIHMGINPSLKGAESPHRFPYIIFCAPPSRSLDYAGDIRSTALSWNGEGSFLFTSSSAPYDCYDNGQCDEDTPSVPIGRSPKTDRLLKAENVVIKFGGCVVRFSGLYKSDRGAHSHWLEKGIVEARPDHILNLIHYEDAASLSVAILQKKLRGQILLGCDNHPLSRQEVMDLVNRSGKFRKKFEAFTGTSGPLGKKLNNSKTRATLGWEPKYSSFEQFLETL